MRKNMARLGYPDICPNCGGKLEKLEKGEGWKNK